MAAQFISAWTDTAAQDPFAAVIYNNSIYLFGQYNQLMLNTIDLNCLQADGTLPPSQQELDKAVTLQPFSINGQYETLHSESPSAAAAVVAGTSLCLFWNDDRKGPLASICAGAAVKAAPRPWFSLSDSSGTPLSQNTSSSFDLAATCIDNQSVLVGMHFDTESGRAIYLGYYDLTKAINNTTDPNEPGTWQASWEWTVTYATLIGDTTVPDFDTSLRLESYSIGGQAAPQSPPSGWLALTTFAPSDNNGYLSWLTLDTTTPGIPLISGLQGTSATIVSVAAPAVVLGSTFPLGIARDPSGSVRVYCVQTSSAGTNIPIWLQPGNEPAGNAAGFITDTLGLCYGPTSTQSLTVDAPLAAVYPVGTSLLPTIIVHNSIPGSASAYGVAEAVFAHVHQSAMTTFSQPIGRGQRVDNILSASTTSSPMIVAQGIFDGPFPLPGVQVAPWATTDTTFAQVKYGTFLDKMSTRSSKHGWTIGTMINKKPAKGFGVAFQFAANYNGSNLTGSGNQYINELDIIQNAVPNHPDDPTNIVANGTVFGSAVGFYANVWRFLVPDPAGGSGYVVAPNAPVWAAIWSALGARTKVVYAPYAVTPGDITSYTREAWNSTMHALGYPSLNYFEEVILANAYPLGPTDPALQLAVAVTSSDQNSVKLQDSNFTESAWTFDIAAYIGYGWTVSVELWGLGAGSEGAIMAGGGFSNESSDVQSTTTGWGISVDRIFLPDTSQPSPIDGTNGVISYSVNLYLLPSSQMWTEEMLALAPEAKGRIDPQSAPWRIVYEVTNYELQGGIFYPPQVIPPAPTTAPIVSPTTLEYPNLQNSIWQSTPTASYMTSFWNAKGEAPGPWSTAIAIGPGSCPQIQIPADPTVPSVTSRRLLYRILDGGSAQLVATISGNDPADNIFYDDAPSATIQPPAALVIADSMQWAGRVDGSSSVWQTHNTVAYAMSFTFSVDSDLPSQWASESMISQLSAPATVLLNAYARLTEVPIFPKGTGYAKCTGRNIYRTVWAGPANESVPLQSLQFVGSIPDNKTTTFTDTTR